VCVIAFSDKFDLRNVLFILRAGGAPLYIAGFSFTIPCMEPIYFNRDLSWVDFNARVLSEALKTGLPLLERFRFLTIVSSNFDEFFMVRIAALKHAGKEGQELLDKLKKKINEIIRKQYDCLLNDLLPDLSKNNLRLVFADDWNELQKHYIELYFLDALLPLLTPLRLNNNPHIPGGTLYAAFSLRAEKNGEKYYSPSGEGNNHIAVVKIPKDRIILLPNESDGITKWALAEDAVLVFAEYLFKGYSIAEKMIFKIDRDADFSVDEDRDDDFIKAMEEVVIKRGSSRAIRMLYASTSDELVSAVAEYLQLEKQDLYAVPKPLYLAGLASLYNIEGFEALKDTAYKGKIDVFSGDDKTIFDCVDEKDILLHLPYESFDPVLRFFSEAAEDDDVCAIKTTLYRTSGDSPVVKSLERAALNGKQVTAVVELKARFDEERNISWAKNLERAGVTVVYGLARLKVHAKIALVSRKERKEIKNYVHLSTGNYNDKTAREYADLCLFTANRDIAADSLLFFNMITGYSDINEAKHLVISPLVLKNHIINLIEREIAKATPARPGMIKAKMNSLSDTDVIDALYRASQKNVKIHLNIRGICMLVPGVKGLSENIRVVSIVDHFLEHSRIVYFENGGESEVYLSSADWMTRNLERRVELMFPVFNPSIKARVGHILDSYFNDNCQAHILEKDGVWKRLSPAPDEKPFKVQNYLDGWTRTLLGVSPETKNIFKVRHS
jgi:polyphosphate kinase